MNKTNVLNDYYGVSKLRMDTWSTLSHAAERLLRIDETKGDMSRLDKTISECLQILTPIERYHAFPEIGRVDALAENYANKEYDLVAREINDIFRSLSTDSYRGLKDVKKDGDVMAPDKHYFCMLFVDNLDKQQEQKIAATMKAFRDPQDKFFYDVVVAQSYEDALIAILVNSDINSVVLRYEFPMESDNPNQILREYLGYVQGSDFTDDIGAHKALSLARALRELRPELDVFWVTDGDTGPSSSQVAGLFNRTFYGQENYLELHLSILGAIAKRYATPFFDVVKKHSQRPIGTFHALPLARGNAIYRSHWIQDMGEFYGKNLFLAESSATTGGLDSLLAPSGNMLEAQRKAAKVFGSKKTWYCTNGTSTANKIVVQAIADPGTIILVDRNCHKSHHYGMVLNGALPNYLDAWPLDQYSVYGAVPFEEIYDKLNAYKSEGRLAEVRMLLLTNCTFDGQVYNVQKLMNEVLKIKPDMVFLWDEAWMAYARFNPLLRQRTAMQSAQTLYQRYHSAEYREEWSANNAIGPNPDEVKIRVYACQSTHKSLASLRQGSMIHMWDEDFARDVEGAFDEAYMTHTSTSPSHQILSSLDLATRQADLEGYELVQDQIENALILRNRINEDPLISKYFSVLTPADLIPEALRQSGIIDFSNRALVEKAWRNDDFVLDPSRITIYLAKAGMKGAEFRELWMDKFGMQCNKTSINTILFMTTIGTTRSAISYLLQSLSEIALELDRERGDASREELHLLDEKVRTLTEEFPPLPNFSRFHDKFRRSKNTPEGHIRIPFYLNYKEDYCHFIKLDELSARVEAGEEHVSAKFVIPYPPGFPVLVPGQIISREILKFMSMLDVKEVHGYNPKFGFNLFTEAGMENARKTGETALPQPG